MNGNIMGRADNLVQILRVQAYQNGRYFVPVELVETVADLLGTRRRRTRRAGFQSICNSPPPPTSSRTRLVLHAPLTRTPTYARREWLGQPCRTPDHGTYFLWDPEQHQPSSTFHATPLGAAQRVPLSKSTPVTELVVSCTKVRGFMGVCGRIRCGGSIRYDVAASLPFFFDTY